MTWLLRLAPPEFFAALALGLFLLGCWLLNRGLDGLVSEPCPKCRSRRTRMICCVGPTEGWACRCGHTFTVHPGAQ